MINDYLLEFDLKPLERLDSYSLIECQNYNFGNNGDWFNHFRKGMSGFKSRILGIKIHYHNVHSWKAYKLGNLYVSPFNATEYHLSSIFFNMDSAIECMVFALNALGYAVDPARFLDVTDINKLKQISPYNIIGKSQPRGGVQRGYDIYFPSLKRLWCENNDFLHLIFEQHDVSKHRSTIYEGGKLRDDPPSDFFKKLGIENDISKQVLFTPHVEILLAPDPKIPWRQREQIEYNDIDKLEDVAEKFCKFINLSCKYALNDATTTIKLKHYELLNSTNPFK